MRREPTARFCRTRPSAARLSPVCRSSAAVCRPSGRLPLVCRRLSLVRPSAGRLPPSVALLPAVCRPSAGRLPPSAAVCRPSATCLSLVCRPSAARLPLVCHSSTARLSLVCRSSVARLLLVCWLHTGPPSCDAVPAGYDVTWTHPGNTVAGSYGIHRWTSGTLWNSSSRKSRSQRSEPSALRVVSCRRRVRPHNGSRSLTQQTPFIVWGPEINSFF